MKIIELDLTGCKYNADIQDRIKIAFEFPEWYGRNWSAFWDLLWSDCDADKLIIKGENTLPKELDKHIAIMHKILDRMVKTTHEDTPFEYVVVS